MFAQNINLAKVHDLQNHILQTKGNIQSVNRENINCICSIFSEIFEESAILALMWGVILGVRMAKNIGLGNSVV